jgi:PAS domain-containing protein
MSEIPEATSLHTPWTTTIESPEVLQRQLTEQRLQTEQLRILGTAVDVAGEGIAILTPAVEALGPRIAFVNDGFCTMFGRRREEVIGQTPLIFGIVERHQAIFDALLSHVFECRPFDA